MAIQDKWDLSEWLCRIMNGGPMIGYTVEIFWKQSLMNFLLDFNITA